MRRVAFEIEDHEILLGPEHLAEMVVAVDPDPGARVVERANRVEFCEQRIADVEHLPRMRARDLVERRDAAAQQIERRYRARACRWRARRGRRDRTAPARMRSR